MLGNITVADLDGATVYDVDDNKIGRITSVYLNDESGDPEFVTVATGLFGSKEAFVPVGNATASGEKIVVPYDKDTLVGAPHFDPEAHLDRGQEHDLQTYYGMAYDGGSYNTTVAFTADDATDDDEDQASRSGEQSAEAVGNTRLQFRKY